MFSRNRSPKGPLLLVDVTKDNPQGVARIRKLQGADIRAEYDQATGKVEVLEKTRNVIILEIDRLNRELENTNLALQAATASVNVFGEVINKMKNKVAEDALTDDAFDEILSEGVKES